MQRSLFSGRDEALQVEPVEHDVEVSRRRWCFTLLDHQEAPAVWCDVRNVDRTIPPWCMVFQTAASTSQTAPQADPVIVQTGKVVSTPYLTSLWLCDGAYEEQIEGVLRKLPQSKLIRLFPGLGKRLELVATPWTSRV
jgi:hypothetical protein